MSSYKQNVNSMPSKNRYMLRASRGLPFAHATYICNEYYYRIPSVFFEFFFWQK